MTKTESVQLSPLEKRLAELQLLIDSVEDYAIVILNPQGRIVTWNPGAERIKGYTAEEILGQHLSVFYPPEDAARGKPEEELRLADARGRFEDEGWRVRKDGSLFWANVVITALRDSDGRLTAFGKVTRDLSQRKWGEEEKFGKIFRFSPTALSITTVDDGRFVEVNEAFSRFTGYTRDELIGRTALEFQLWPHADDRNRMLEELKEHRVLRDCEGAIRHKSAEERVGLLSCEFIELGGQACILAAIRDVTEHRRIEEQLRHANEKLAAWVPKLERRTHQITLLGKMTDMLQSCLVAEEAYEVVAHCARELFPGESGALYVKDASAEAMEAVTTWGPDLASDPSIEPDHCWALRRGRMHWVPDRQSGMVCRHLKPAPPKSWLCVPIMAKGEALGMFHLQTSHAETDAHDAGNGVLTRAKRGPGVSTFLRLVRAVEVNIIDKKCLTRADGLLFHCER